MSSSTINSATLSGRDFYKRVAANIANVISGHEEAIKQLLVAFAAGGHVLMEDYPGTGKTTLAKALALSFSCCFKRVQFTPDLLPSDIIGVSIFDGSENKFHFHQGPIFTNILLVDEINRASPRTQAALLEAMAEAQVSIDGTIHPLPDLFFVIATQNPVGSHGTYPLPEAQLDRFALKFGLGYVSAEEEVKILFERLQSSPLQTIQPCISVEDVLTLKQDVKQVRISPEVGRYIVDIVAATRSHPNVQLGASPRASLTLMKTAQAQALFDGYTFVTPEQVQALANSVIAHRLVLETQAKFSGITPRGVIEEILSEIPLPT